MGLIQIAVFGALLGVTLGHHTSIDHSKNQDALNLIQRSIFTPDYNINVRPYSEAGPTKVTLQLKNLRAIEVDEVRGAITFQAISRARWNDPRLAYNATILPDLRFLPIRDCKGVMWLPDVYDINGLESQYESKKHSPTRFTGIAPSGDVFFSKRFTKTLFCPELFNTAAPEITCQSIIQSYSYYDDELQLLFDTKEAVINNNRDALSLQRFNYEGATTAACTDVESDLLKGHQYSCVKLLLKFTRKAIA